MGYPNALMQHDVLPISELTAHDLSAWRDLAGDAVSPNPFAEPELVVPAARMWPAPTEAEGALVALLAAFPAAQRSELSFRTREQVRPGPSPYRVQVAASVSGPTNELVIDMRERRAAA